MKDRLLELVNVKSLVTLMLTTVFSVLAIRGDVAAGQFLTEFTVVISFYFGVQFEKNNAEGEKRIK